MKTHENLFNYTKDVREAYNALMSDQQRDTEKLKWTMRASWGLLAIAALLYVNLYTGMSLYFAFLGLGALVQGLFLFVDLSNRNFLLHMIDFVEARAKETGGT